MLTKCHCLQPLHEHAGEPDDGVERPASDSSTRFTWTSHSGCRTATLRALVDKREACHADVHDDDAHPAVELTTGVVRIGHASISYNGCRWQQQSWPSSHRSRWTVRTHGIGSVHVPKTHVL